ncbi:hypothetical protein [Bartonella jaculi]|uniref:Bacteriocin n=1 Tax=Bartonella jaculi TaxID=686226 RepID=A0ABP9N255_9HYPH
MRNFGSGLVYNLNDSTPVYGNACSVNDFAYNMAVGGLNGAFHGGVGGAFAGAWAGGPAGALSSGLIGAGGGFLAGAGWGFVQKAHECWF